MAYAAVIVLKHTITERLQKSTITDSAIDELNWLERSLNRLDLDETRKRRVDMSVIDAVDAEIRDAVFKLEDAVESHLFHHSLPPLHDELTSFVMVATELRRKYEAALEKPSMLSIDDGDDATVDDGFGGDKSSTTVGLQDEVDLILEGLRNPACQPFIASFVGMAGIGKTHLARLIYQHPLLDQHFDVKVWVRVGQRISRPKRILVEILAQIECKPRDVFMEQKKNELVEHLRNRLDGLRSIFFLDDVWSQLLIRDLMRMFDDVPARFFVTTRLEAVAWEGYYKYTEGKSYPEIHTVRFLNNEESWKLFRQNVFGDEYFSIELEIAGKKIVENCEGLPLLILTVADILRGFDKTEEYWNKVAEMKTSTFPDAYERIWDVLYSSYEFLPQDLKPCFLYMGVFPQRFEILFSRIIQLLVVEDFLDEDFRYRYCLDVVISNSLAIKCKQSSYDGIKSFKLHSAYWYLCVKEAKKVMFFHVLKRLSDADQECIERQRRLSVQTNMLLGIKEVHDSLNAVQTTRSLLFTGVDHQYPVPLCPDMVFLKLLDALAIRFYEFPIEVLKLFQLKYLALTHSGDLPSSISNLRELQSLILHQHHNITFIRDSTSLPKEIWDMTELKHLRIVRSNLPDPIEGTMLWKLSTLRVDARSCREGVFRSLPNLKKLGIYIELLPDATEISSCFKHVELLEELDSLTCVVVNPRVVIAQPIHLPDFPQYLRKLSLSGLGYSWDCITAINWLPELKVLKLRCCAFRGPEWRMKAEEFPNLSFLLLEDMDLVQWTADSNHSFESLRDLIIRHCYKLKVIPWQIQGAKYLKMIELDECRTSVVDSARKIQKEKDDWLYPCEVVVTSSWNR